MPTFTLLDKLVAYQRAALRWRGGRWRAVASVPHVKLHGALSNVACADDGAVAAAVVAAVPGGVDPGLASSSRRRCPPSRRAGAAAGVAVAPEVFADRAYLADGQSMPRGRPGAVLHDAGAAAAHAAARGAHGAGRRRGFGDRQGDQDAHRHRVHSRRHATARSISRRGVRQALKDECGIEVDAVQDGGTPATTDSIAQNG